MTLLLIDGDDLVWRAACVSPDASALRGALAERIDGIVQALRGDRAIFALSDRANWRKTLWPGYKAHRAARPRPPLLAAARDALCAGWETRTEPALEADDVLGLAATDPGFRARASGAQKPIAEPGLLAALRAEHGAAGELVVVSRDKDLATVPCLLAKPGGRARRVSMEEADLAHLTLALSGDPADGYRGCPGVGMRRAARILEAAPPEPAARWRAVLAAYERAGLGEEQALLQARLARVLRAGEIDAAGRPLLWAPP